MSHGLARSGSGLPIRTWLGYGLLLLLPVAGCGARASLDPADGLTAEGTLGGAGGSRGGGGAVGGGGSGAGAGVGEDEPFHFETTRLPECELGFVRGSGGGGDCRFRFEGLCYGDELSVCACACPREGNTVCVLSGFLGDPDEPLQVTCGGAR